MDRKIIVSMAAAMTASYWSGGSGPQLPRSLSPKQRFDGQTDEARDAALQKAELKRQKRAAKRIKALQAHD